MKLIVKLSNYLLFMETVKLLSSTPNLLLATQEYDPSSEVLNCLISNWSPEITRRESLVICTSLCIHVSEGVGCPVARHTNTTSSPGSAIVLVWELCSINGDPMVGINWNMLQNPNYCHGLTDNSQLHGFLINTFAVWCLTSVWSLISKLYIVYLHVRTI